MNAPKRNQFETSSTSKSAPARPSICPWRSAVSRLIPLFKLTSLLKPLNGKSSMPIWQLMKRSREQKSRNKWKTERTRSLCNRLSPLLKTLSIPPQWSVLSKLWREWLSRMLMKRSSTITDTTPSKLMTLLPDPLTAQSFLCGVSQPNAAERSTSPPSAGTLNTMIYSLSAMVHTIS